MKLIYVSFALFALFMSFCVCYYAEVNRSILLFAIYPMCIFGALGFCALSERE